MGITSVTAAAAVSDHPGYWEYGEMSEQNTYPDRRNPGYIITTPTPPWGIPNPCKFRGKTIDILEAVSNSKGLTTKEIADKTDIPVRVVSIYCINGEKRGVFERIERWGWAATPFGLFILDINYNNNNNNNVKTKLKEGKNEVKTKLNRTLDSSRKTYQLNLSIFTSRSDISEPERVVVEVLVEHYERTGEKYRYFKDPYHFCDTMDVSAVDAPAALARLKEEGCIYTRKDEFGWKIGLKVNFVERLKYR